MQDFKNYFDILKNGLCTFNNIPKKKEKNINDLKDYFTFELMRIVLNRFVYTNLPHFLTSEIVEYFLTTSNFNIFKKDEFDEEVKLYRANLYGKMNIYGMGENGTAYAANGAAFNFSIYDKDIVTYVGSLYSTTDFNTIEYYANILNEIYKSFIISIKNQKNPRVLAGSKDSLLSMKNFYGEIEQGNPVIFLKDTCNIEDVKSFDLTNNYNCDKLLDLYRNVYKEFLNRFGIEDFANDSRERLVSDEVHSTDNIIEINRNIGLKNRIDFINRTNERFGTDIKIRFNSNLNTEVNRATQNLYNIFEGGGEDEQIHN